MVTFAFMLLFIIILFFKKMHAVRAYLTNDVIYIVTCLLSHIFHSGGWSGVLVQRSVYDCRHMHQLLSLSRDDVGTEWQQAIGKVKSCLTVLCIPCAIFLLLD